MIGECGISIKIKRWRNGISLTCNPEYQRKMVLYNPKLSDVDAQKISCKICPWNPANKLEA